MTIISTISSTENYLIKQIIKLNNNVSYRKETGLAVIYGEHLVSEALNSDILQTVFFDYTVYANINASNYLELSASVAINELIAKISKFEESLNPSHQNKTVTQIKQSLLDRKLIAKICPLETKVPVLGIINPKRNNDVKQVNEQLAALYRSDCILLEKIQDPANLGMIMRLARAFNIQNIILSNGCVDPYNPKVIRASSGLQFKLNIFTDINLSEFISNYKGLTVITTPKASTSIDNWQMLPDTPLAWVFGNEGSGVSLPLLNLAQTQLKIQIHADVESINVANSVAICLFMMQKQRSL